MPRNDFLCEACGWHEAVVHEADTRPPCPICGASTVWAPRPGSYVMDNYDVRAFDFTHNGQTHRIDSLETLRKVERLTEQQARNGEGSPAVWRDYSQEKSNQDRHTLTKDLTRPIGGYAEGTTGVDRKFAGGRGADVTRKHGEAT